MTTPRLSSPVPLSRATSRTRTARAPISTIEVAHVEGSANLGSIYAGPVVLAARSRFVPGTLAYPPMSEAVQIYGVATDEQQASMVLVLDLGKQYDVSRVELYGNLMLPPSMNAGRPVHNFGLPRGVGVAVSEEFQPYLDAHRRMAYNVWSSPEGQPWHQRSLTYDLRALWGWTPIHLPPTFGRYLMLYFWDFPLIDAPGSIAPRPGIDIQRMLLYPFAQDTDHRPLIETAPVASWQTVYDQSSRYWSLSGVANPEPEMRQSLFRAPNDAVLIPGVLDGVVHEREGQKPAPLYSSDRVKVGTNNRVLLVVQATADETPLVNGLALLFTQPSAAGLPGHLYDYRIAAHVTNDAEAAWSPKAHHPAWRLAMEPRLVRASAASPNLGVRLMFPYVQYARYVRLTVEVLDTAGSPNDDARFILAALSLMRPRDYVLAPEDGQDMRVDYVVMRMRGAELFSDHAFVDGANGAGLTLEVQEAGGPFRTLQSFRTLLDLLENTQNRAYSNQRYADKPVQITHEVADSASSGSQSTRASTTSDVTAVADFNDGNYQVTQAGSVTEHKDNMGAGPDRPYFWLQQGPLGFVQTERRYGAAPDDHFPTAEEIFGTNIPQNYHDFWGRIDDVIAHFDRIGRPLSLSVGGSGSLNFSLGAGGSVGISVSASGQVGGGVSRSSNTGKQGAVTTTETTTLEAKNRQTTSGSQTADTILSGTMHDDRRVVRTDESTETRKSGIAIQYGGNAEDILLVAIPVNALLKGHDSANAISATVGGLTGGLTGQPDVQLKPQAPRDVLRLRIDHLPPGVTLDVEFRGSIMPREGSA